MGHVNVTITLKNNDDAGRAADGKITEQEVRQATVEALVDTGATMLVINEKVYRDLGLKARGQRKTTFGNDAKEICTLTEPVEIQWKDRSIAMPALVVKDASEILLGVLPLEGMDLIVDPVRQRLVGAHGDQIVYLAKEITAHQ